MLLKGSIMILRFKLWFLPPRRANPEQESSFGRTALDVLLAQDANRKDIGWEGQACHGHVADQVASKFKTLKKCVHVTRQSRQDTKQPDNIHQVQPSYFSVARWSSHPRRRLLRWVLLTKNRLLKTQSPRSRWSCRRVAEIKHARSCRVHTLLV